mmetsp:Transcript_43377/g.80772  ORF Transcript_43377/g.80772 Transcript_43377/m.80772 type:complete len:724 (-) Transcript_43377:54-2225(-)
MSDDDDDPEDILDDLLERRAGGSRKRKREDDGDCTAELFRSTFPMDDRAYEYLTSSPRDVQEKVIRSFRPKKEGEDDYSSLITTVVKKARLEATGEESHSSGMFAGKGPSMKQLEEFKVRFPMDDRAWDFLTIAPGAAQQKVLNEFNRPEGELDYSAAVTAFLKPMVARSSEVRGINRSRLEFFRQEFPMDDRAFEFLVTSSPEIQLEAMKNFNPPGVRDSDYSRPLTSYLRKLRDTLPAMFSPRTFANDYGSNKASLEEFRRKYQMDDRAFEYLQQAPAQVQEKVIAKFRPPSRSRSDSDFSAAITTFVRLNLQEWSDSTGAGHASHESSAGFRPMAEKHGVALPSEFLDRYPMDDRALQLLNQAPAAVQEAVVAKFRPRSEGDLDYSGAITSFVRRMTDEIADSRPPLDAPRRAKLVGREAHEGQEANRHLRRFRSRYPMDDRAFDFLVQHSAEVQEAVIAKFRPRSEGDADYSGAVTSFVRKTRDSLKASEAAAAPQRQGVTLRSRFLNLREFRLRYPMDDRAFDFLEQAPTSVQEAVVSKFKPRSEGDEDYSGAVTTFTRRMKNEIGYERQGSDKLRHLLHRFRGKYPMDDRAFDFLSQLSDELQEIVINEFRPRREGDSDYSAAVTSFVRTMRHRVGADSGEGASKRRRTSGSEIQPVLEYFRRQYPMDDRAWEFLSNSSESVQREVIERFRPNREGSDYSPLITSFVRQCQASHGRS